MIAELFPKNSKGYLHYKKYNNPENPVLFLQEYLGDAEITEQEFLNNGRSLSQDASVSTVTNGSKWLIIDRNTVYKLNKESNKIPAMTPKQWKLLKKSNKEPNGGLLADDGTR